MGEAFILSLEVDDNGSIKIQNFKKQVEAAGGAADKAGKQAGESGAVGFQIFGRAAEKGAEAVGLPYRSSTLLGTQVERMAKSSFPQWGIALGVAGGAAMVAAGVTMYLIDRKQKLREELEKNITALQGEMKVLYSNEQVTRAMQSATEDLAKAKRMDLDAKLEKKIATETKEYQKQLDTLAQFDRVAIAETGSIIHTEMLDQLRRDVAILKAQIKSDTDELKLYSGKGDIGYSASARLASEAEYTAARLGLMKAQGEDYRTQQIMEQAIFDQTTAAKLAGMTNAEQKKDFLATRAVQRATLATNQETEVVKVQFDSQLAAEIAYLTAQDELWNAEQQNYAGHMDMQQAIFDAQTTRELTALSAKGESADAIRAAWAVRELMWNKTLLTDTQKTEKLKQQAATQTLDHSANAFKMMADIGGKYGREAFRAYQIAAIGRTIMTTKSAMMAAYEPPPVGVGPIYGSALAAAIFLEGAASVATIASQSYSGGGGAGGGGAVGTYNANSATGLPENKGYQQYYEQDPKNPNSYGTGWRPGENASQSHVTVEVVVNDDAFSAKVVKVASQNYIDQGDLHGAINGE